VSAAIPFGRDRAYLGRSPTEPIDLERILLIQELSMNCYAVYLDDPKEIPEGWLGSVQASLFKKWTATTRHRPGASGGTWACEIYHGCSTCSEHLSLPCSLLAEANEITSFLGSACYSDEPATYFRIYLMILSEFAAQLESVAQLMSLRTGKKPRLVALWANGWAKHRLQILLQHHPLMAFADAYGGRWAVAQVRFRDEPFVDRCGNRQPTRIIDTKWLESHHGRQTCKDANGPGRAIILVPPMMTFLDEVIGYFRGFVDACLKDPERIRAFESSSFVRGC
jgi:hypothetical protein